ncbi:hypothetical protein N9195_00995 [bacterium]|nr:hypothetical protein [bacterium]
MNSNLSFALAFAALVAGLGSTRAQVTFSEHISPIIYNNCTVCHREGEIGPFPLTTFEEAADSAESILVSTQERLMPPWPPDRHFSRFVGERGLTEEQHQLIADWVAAGAPQGDPSLEATIPAFPEGSLLGEPDLVLKMSEAFPIRGNNRDEYRVFVLPTGLTEDKDIVALEFRPGNPSIVHHALFAMDSSGEARRLDNEDQRPGYESFGGFGVPLRQGLSLGGWVPGATPRFYPAATGVRLPANSDLLLQVHYAPWPVTETDQSTVNLFFADKPVERQVKNRLMLPSDLVDENGDYFLIPPALAPFSGALIGSGIQTLLGESVTPAQIQALSRNETADTVFGDQLGGTVAGFLDFDIPAGTTRRFRAIWKVKDDISLLNVWPHMHYLGRDWEITLERPDGSTENLIRINDWDFNWQGSYTFTKYIKVPAGSVIHASALYDNTSQNPFNPSFPPVDVGWGEKTEDEMFFLPFTYVDYQPGDELISLEGLATGDSPPFRIESLVEDRISFRLKTDDNPYLIEYSIDMKLWQTVGVEEEVGGENGWQFMSLPRDQESKGFYRARLYREVESE